MRRVSSSDRDMLFRKRERGRADGTLLQAKEFEFSKDIRFDDGGYYLEEDHFLCDAAGFRKSASANV